jgi:hypothetical protein
MAETELPHDVRWKQRLDEYARCLAWMKRVYASEPNNILESLGFMKAFHLTATLALDALRVVLGRPLDFDVEDSEDVLQQAINAGLLRSAMAWTRLPETYQLVQTPETDYSDLAVVRTLVEKIRSAHLPLLLEFAETDFSPMVRA